MYRATMSSRWGRVRSGGSGAPGATTCSPAARTVLGALLIASFLGLGISVIVGWRVVSRRDEEIRSLRERLEAIRPQLEELDRDLAELERETNDAGGTLRLDNDGNLVEER